MMVHPAAVALTEPLMVWQVLHVSVLLSWATYVDIDQRTDYIFSLLRGCRASNYDLS